MRVVITGGGTGGHIYPGLAIEAALREDCAARGESFASLFIGSARGLESTIVRKAGVDVAFVPSRPLSRRNLAKLPLTAGANAVGFAAATRMLARFKPDVVIASGGYVCAPVVAAARALRVARRIEPVIGLLEPNARPGLTNRLLMPLVDEVWCAPWTFASAFGKKAVVTGIPVRGEFKSLPPRPLARERLGIEGRATVVTILGGSQGARSINDAVIAMLVQRELPPGWWILHICGERDYSFVQAGLREKKPHNHVTLVPYFDEPSPAYAAADLVVARAGASTLAELAATGRPALLIPYPHAAEDHQTANARVFAENGAARLLFDAELNGDVLFYALSEALAPESLAAMAKASKEAAPADAAAMIVRRVRVLRDERNRP